MPQPPALPVSCPVPKAYDPVTWNGYITITTDALARDPLFYSAPVNDPTDPLTVGMCEATRCERLGDFFDLVVAPDGTPWAAFVGGCVVDRCESSFGYGEGIVGHLVGGPSLR